MTLITSSELPSRVLIPLYVTSGQGSSLLKTLDWCAGCGEVPS